MRTILYSLLFTCLALQVWGQVPTLNIFPAPDGLAQCSGVEIIYYVYPWSSSCPVQVTVSGGEVVKQTVYNGKLEITLIWEAPLDSARGRIELQWPDSLCLQGGSGKAWDFAIISNSTFKPVISGATPYYYMGENNSYSLQAILNLGLPGSGAASQFEWEAPADWSFFSYGPTNEFAALTIPPNNTLVSGCLRVRGKYPCGTWSDWTDYCLVGTIHTPCPVYTIGDYFLCGDTSERQLYAQGIILPQTGLYNWWVPEYTWTVPPGWTILSANPSSKSIVTVKPDGHSEGSVTVVARAGGFISAVCEYPVTLLQALPGTFVSGPDYVCTQAEFPLNYPPAPLSDISWQVMPLDPATPQIVVPDHGNGLAAFQVNDPDMSGYFRITYTISGSCGSLVRSKDFFVGKPSFFNTTLDGAPYATQPVCAGYHGLKTEVTGMSEPLVRWSSAAAGLTGYTQRDSFVFSLNPAEAPACPIVTASANNFCGTAEKNLELCLRPDCQAPQLDLRVYPNPAYLIVSLETTVPNSVAGDYGLIGDVEIFNAMGQLVTTWHETPGNRIIKSIVDLPDGVYTLRVAVWGQIIKKRLVIARLF